MVEPGYRRRTYIYCSRFVVTCSSI